MFWLVIAHVEYTKSHEKDMDPAHQLVQHYFHIIYKVKPEFREDFKYSELTEDDQERVEEFTNRDL